MGLDISWAGLMLMAGLLGIGGLATGFLAGLLGVGGGGILVPVLYELFSVLHVPEAIRMHMAVGTSLAVIIPTSVRSYQAHAARGSVDHTILRGMAMPVLLGVLAGIAIADRAGGWVLKLVFVLLCVLISAKTIFGGDRWRLGNELPGRLTTSLVGGVIGLDSALVGIGGGAQISAFLTLYGRPILQAVGTASGFGPIIAVPAALGYIWAGWGTQGLPPGSLGFVSLLGAALIIPTSVYAAPYGARLAHGIKRRTLELSFAAFLLFLAARFTWSLVG